MPTSKEFAIRMEDRPGTLGKVCRALADRGVNILAFQSFPSGEKSQVCIVVDNPKIGYIPRPGPDGRVVQGSLPGRSRRMRLRWQAAHLRRHSKLHWVVYLGNRRMLLGRRRACGQQKPRERARDNNS